MNFTLAGLFSVLWDEIEQWDESNERNAEN